MSEAGMFTAMRENAPGLVLMAVLLAPGCGRKEPSQTAPVPVETAGPAREQAAPSAAEAVTPPSEPAAAPPPGADLGKAEKKSQSGRAEGDLLDAEGESSGGRGEAPKDAAQRAPSPRAPGVIAPSPARSKRKADGSGSGIGTTDEDEASGEVRRASAELEREFGRFGDALALSSPDCPGARQFGERICSLAERICQLAEASRNPSELALCVDGRQRCGEARRRLSDQCGD